MIVRLGTAARLISLAAVATLAACGGRPKDPNAAAQNLVVISAAHEPHDLETALDCQAAAYALANGFGHYLPVRKGFMIGQFVSVGPMWRIEDGARVAYGPFAFFHEQNEASGTPVDAQARHERCETAGVANLPAGAMTPRILNR